MISRRNDIHKLIASGLLLCFVMHFCFSYYAIQDQQRYHQHYLSEKLKLELSFQGLAAEVKEQVLVNPLSVFTTITHHIAVTCIGESLPKAFFVSLYERNSFYHHITINAP